MKKLLVILATGFLWACANNEGSANSEHISDSTDRLREINEGVTNATKIANDSMIGLIQTINTGTDPSRTDTSGEKMD